MGKPPSTILDLPLITIQNGNCSWENYGKAQFLLENPWKITMCSWENHGKTCYFYGYGFGPDTVRHQGQNPGRVRQSRRSRENPVKQRRVWAPFRRPGKARWVIHEGQRSLMKFDEN